MSKIFIELASLNRIVLQGLKNDGLNFYSDNKERRLS